MVASTAVQQVHYSVNAMLLASLQCENEEYYFLVVTFAP